MSDVIALIDGFNMYHALDQRSRFGGYPYRKFKWINYWLLAECFVPHSDVMRSVTWFTAKCPWKGNSGDLKRERHQKLRRANEHYGVEVVVGYFRLVTKKRVLINPRGFIQYDTYEEKRTDVALAVMLVSLAHQRTYDKAVIVTADSDMIPAIEEAKRVHKDGTIINAVPIERRAQALKNYVDQQISMQVKHVETSLLPAIVDTSPGRRVERPIEWKGN